jgi:hypothetical protein
VGCHQPDYDLTASPPHKAGQFSTDCTTCHNTTAWQPSTFVHPASPISVSGAHAAVTCTQCHTTVPYSTAKTTCDGCHHADYVATNNPNHTAAGYSTDCASCHQVVANWAGAAVNHPTTPIALTGVHANRQCTDCHLAGQAYAAVQQTCDGCHHTDYVGAKDPDHVAAVFSATCTDCHALVAGWTGATYANHSTTPINPKQGAHGAVTCAQCHTRTPYSSAPTTCDGCHHTDYTTTTNPNHASAGFAVTCSDCHQIVAGWTGATYASHPSTPIALTGVHSISLVTCAQCHTTSPYSSVATDCYGCHKPDYDKTTNPKHTPAAFPTTCTSCHGLVAGWANATFTHNASIKTTHGSSKACTDCHTNTNDYGIFACYTGCHHTQANTNSISNHCKARSGNTCTTWVTKNGVTYDPNSTTGEKCYSCHPSGNAG